MKRHTANAAAELNRPLRRRRYLLGDPDRTRATAWSALVLFLIVLMVVLPLAVPVAAILWVSITLVRVRRSGALITAGVGAVAFVAAGGPVASLRRWSEGPQALYRFVHQVITDKGTSVAAAWHEQTAGLAGRWLLGQIPLALLIGGLLAWWLGWLRWLHTDEWMIPEPRKGMLARLRQRRITVSITAGRLVSTPDAAVMGVDNKTGGRLDLYDDERRGHVLVVGANGSGKSTTVFKIFEADLDRGRPVFFTDLKGLPQDRLLIQAATEIYRVPCVTFTLDGGSWWDPFRPQHRAGRNWWDLARIADRGERSNLLLAMHNFGNGPASDYYRTAAKEFLDLALDVIDATPQMPYESTLETLLELAEMNTLTSRASQIPIPEAAEGAAARSQLNTRLAAILGKIASDKDLLNGYLSGLSAMAYTAAGRHLRIPQCPAEQLDSRDGLTYIGGLPVMDLAAIRTRGAVALFCFNKTRDGDMTARLGRLAVANQTTVFGQMAEVGDLRRTLVIVDEFSALEANTTKDLMVRSRGAGADVVLATQAIEDIEIAADSRAAAGQMLSNVNVVIAHRIGDGEAAKRVAAVAGTRRGVKRRYESEESQSAITADRGGTTGGTYADEDPMTPEVLPTVLQDLTPGQWVLIARSARFGTRIVQQARTIVNASLPTEPSPAAPHPRDPQQQPHHTAPVTATTGPQTKTAAWGVTAQEHSPQSRNPFTAPAIGASDTPPPAPVLRGGTTPEVPPGPADNRRPPPMPMPAAALGLIDDDEDDDPPPDPLARKQSDATSPAPTRSTEPQPAPVPVPVSRLSRAATGRQTPETPTRTRLSSSKPRKNTAATKPAAAASTLPIPPMPGTDYPPPIPAARSKPRPQPAADSGPPPEPVVTFGQFNKNPRQRPPARKAPSVSDAPDPRTSG